MLIVKRAARPVMWLGLIALAGTAIAPAGCSRSPAAPTEEASAQLSRWIVPPQIESVEQAGDGLAVRGVAPRRGRIVLIASSGDSYAASADGAGRFEIRIPPLAQDVLFQPGVQSGQDVAVGTERLLIARDGLVALLTLGGPSRRLDRTAPLVAVDSDGQALIVSGRTSPGAAVALSLNGSRIPAKVDAEGRWSVLLNAGAGAAVLGVDGARYLYPGGDAPARQGLTVTRAGDGRRVDWSPGSGGGQTVWFPDSAGTAGD